jgi:pimeloyl-ACP methyl ester carboxylesterase
VDLAVGRDRRKRRAKIGTPMNPALESKLTDVVIDGKRLETLWFEPRDASAPAIVILHEGLGSIALWKDFPHKLAARTGCGVLVYSRYGHGNSDKLAGKRPVEFMHQEGEVVLPELLDELGIARPILLGHSDGGSIALIFAGKFPERTRALILEAPHVFVEDLSVASIAAAKVSFETTDFRAKLGRYHAHVDETFWGWNDIWLDPRFRSWNIEAYLDSIRCPVLCIQGEEDEYGTPAQVEPIRARVAGTEIMMLPNCKHAPHRDQQAVTLDKMAEFVVRVARIKSKPRICTDGTDWILNSAG